jgi:hypothetical protein
MDHVAQVIVYNFTVSGAECKPMLRKNDTIGLSGFESLCTRIGNSGINILLNAASTTIADTPLSEPPIVPLPRPLVRQPIVIRAIDFKQGQSVAAAQGVTAQWGPDTLLNAPPGWSGVPNMAQWDFDVSMAGNYALDVEFAAQDVRPVQIDIDGKLFLAQGLAEATGGWLVTNQRFIRQGSDVYLSAGSHTIRFSRANVFPHIRTLRFTPVD